MKCDRCGKNEATFYYKSNINGRVTQVIEFDDGSKIELPLDKNGNLKWFDDSKLIKKAS